MHEPIDTLRLLKLLGVSKASFEKCSVVRHSGMGKAMAAHNAYDLGMTPALATDFARIEDEDCFDDVTSSQTLARLLRENLGPYTNWNNFVSARISDIRALREHIRPLAKDSNLAEFLKYSALPSELLDFHAEKFSEFQRRLHHDPVLRNACLLIRKNKRLNLEGTNVHDAMRYIYTQMAEIWGVVVPSILFDLDARAKRTHKDQNHGFAGEATEIQSLAGNRKIFYFRTHLTLKSYGDETLDTLFHELAHAIEKHLRIRLLGEKIDRSQTPYLKQTDVDRWPLRVAAALMLLNQPETGVYVEPEESFETYEGQVSERHCNWFAGEAMRAVRIASKNRAVTPEPWRRSYSGFERYYLPNLQKTRATASLLTFN